MGQFVLYIYSHQIEGHNSVTRQCDVRSRKDFGLTQTRAEEFDDEFLISTIDRLTGNLML